MSPTNSASTPLLNGGQPASEARQTRPSAPSAPSAPRLSCFAHIKIWSLRAASITAFVLGGLSIGGTLPSLGSGALIGGLLLGLGSVLGLWAREVQLREVAEATLRMMTGGSGGGGGGGQSFHLTPESPDQSDFVDLRGTGIPPGNNSGGQVVSAQFVVIHVEQPEPQASQQDLDRVLVESDVVNTAQRGLARITIMEDNDEARTGTYGSTSTSSDQPRT
ncbi:hypothetical protein AAKU67_003347 [Oxalobacteraceae bacterium GrIS 2.11]